MFDPGQREAGGWGDGIALSAKSVSAPAGARRTRFLEYPRGVGARGAPFAGGSRFFARRTTRTSGAGTGRVLGRAPECSGQGGAACSAT